MPIHQLHNSHGSDNYNANIYESLDFYCHFHSNFELLYTLRGACSLKIDDRTEILSHGHFALVLPNQLHSFHIPADSRVWVGVFSEEYVFRFASHTRGMIGDQSCFKCDPVIEAFFIQQLINEKTEDIYLLKAVFYAVCHEYLHHIELHPREATGDNLFVRITDYVNDNFREPITLQQMAQTLGFEYHYLSRRFHEIFQMNFRSFLNQYRVTYANDLLQRNPNTTIAEIAYACGFQNVRSFNAAYKQLNGCSPSARRASIKVTG